MATLIAQFKASVGTTLSTSATTTSPSLAAPADGTSIATWFDNTGNNTTIFSQANAPDQPAYKASGSGLSGHPCLDFSNANTHTTGGGPMLTERAAALLNTFNAAHTVLFLAYRYDQDANTYESYLGPQGVGDFLINYRGQNSFTRFSTGPVATPSLPAGVHAIVYVYDPSGNSEAIYIDSAATPAATSAAGRSADAGGTTYSLGSTVTALNGEVYEVRVYSGAMSNTDIAGVFAAWNTEYGTTFNASAGPLTASTVSAGTITKTSIALVATSGIGGSSPYTYQWYRSTSNGSASSIAVSGNALSGATGTTFTDTGLSVQTPYYYVLKTTDSTNASVLSAVLMAQTHGAISIGIACPGDSITFGAAVTHGVTDPVTVMAQALQQAYPASDIQAMNMGVSGQLFREAYSPLTYSSDSGYTGNASNVANLIETCNSANPPIKIVSLMEGTNDWGVNAGSVPSSGAGSSLTPVNYGADIAAVASALAAAGITLMVHQLIYRTSSNADDATVGLPAWNAKIAAQSFSSTLKQGDTTAYANFKANASELADGLHPNVAGSVTLGQAWATALGPLVAAAIADSGSGDGDSLTDEEIKAILDRRYSFA